MSVAGNNQFRSGVHRTWNTPSVFTAAAVSSAPAFCCTLAGACDEGHVCGQISKGCDTWSFVSECGQPARGGCHQRSRRRVGCDGQQTRAGGTSLTFFEVERANGLCRCPNQNRDRAGQSATGNSCEPHGVSGSCCGCPPDEARYGQAFVRGSRGPPSMSTPIPTTEVWRGFIAFGNFVSGSHHAPAHVLPQCAMLLCALQRAPANQLSPPLHHQRICAGEKRSQMHPLPSNPTPPHPWEQ